MNHPSIRQILDNVPAGPMRNMLTDVLDGKVVKYIRCNSEECQGRIIGHIYLNGNIVPITNEKGEMFMRAFRHRLDGALGFECWCGNDSRLCDAEKGVHGIEHNAVTKADLQQVWNNLQKKSVKYEEVDGKLDIDNFVIETI